MVRHFSLSDESDDIEQVLYARRVLCLTANNVSKRDITTDLKEDILTLIESLMYYCKDSFATMILLLFTHISWPMYSGINFTKSKSFTRRSNILYIDDLG